MKPVEIQEINEDEKCCYNCLWNDCGFCDAKGYVLFEEDEKEYSCKFWRPGK